MIAGLADAGFVAGVTTRSMGTMADAANRAKALELAGLGTLPSYSLKQVHDNAVHDVAAPAEEGDGWIVREPGRVALTYHADCTPIFIWSRDEAAVLHSGWKGTRANIVASAVAKFRSKPLAAWVGPRIGVCCYAVGDEFEGYFRGESLERRAGKLYLDLAAEAAAQLRAAGVCEVSTSPACTACGGEFFSYRREKSGNRMMAFLAKRHV